MVSDAVIFEYIKLVAPLIFIGGLVAAIYGIMTAKDEIR